MIKRSVHNFLLYLCLFLCFRSDRLWNTLYVPLDLCEDLIEVLHLLVFCCIDLWSHKLCWGRCNKHYTQEYRICVRRTKKNRRDLTCLSAVVTGFALFLCFTCLFATWKTFFCFFPFCLFFAMLPGERENTSQQGCVHARATCCTMFPVFPFPCSKDTVSSSIAQGHYSSKEDIIVTGSPHAWCMNEHNWSDSECNKSEAKQTSYGTFQLCSWPLQIFLHNTV